MHSLTHLLKASKAGLDQVPGEAFSVSLQACGVVHGSAACIDLMISPERFSCGQVLARYVQPQLTALG